MTTTFAPITRTTPTAAPAATVLSTSPVTAGWHPDPRREHKLRWHDGAGWTDHVTHHGPVPCQACDPARH